MYTDEMQKKVKENKIDWGAFIFSSITISEYKRIL